MLFRRTFVAVCIVLVAAGILAPVGAATAGADRATGLDPTGVIQDTTVTFDGDSLTLHPRPGQTVSGTTDIESGRTVTVRLRSAGSSPFIRSAETTVDADGTFAVTYDLSDVNAPTNATVSVHADGERVAGPVEVAIVTATTDTATTVTEPTESPGQPGFGAGVALVALVIGLLVRPW